MSLPSQGPAISTGLLLRLIVILIAAWSLLAGLTLTAFHGASAGALGVGVADEAGQRLVGAHLLLLVPAYIAIAWKPDRYGRLLWLPFFAQATVVIAVGYNILSGDTEFEDGILAVAVSGMLAVSLGFVWLSEQRTGAHYRAEAEQEEGRLLGARRELEEP